MRDRVLLIPSEVLVHRAENAAWGVPQTFALGVVPEVAEELADTLLSFVVFHLVTHGR